MQFKTFFNIEGHFKNVQGKVIKCLTSQSVHLSLAGRMPEILEILTDDIEYVLPRLYEDIKYQRDMKNIKLSNTS